MFYYPTTGEATLAWPWPCPWVADSFLYLKSVHFRPPDDRHVTDQDIAVLVRVAAAPHRMLQVFKLDKCSSFPTCFLPVAAARCLRTLFLEESSITENDCQWLHELATSNTVLETLNFYMTDLRISWKDLDLIAKNCHSLVSTKISDCDVSNLSGVFRSATALEEFCGDSFSDQVETSEYEKVVCLPPRLCHLGLSFMGTNEMHIIFPFATALKKLDFQYTFLSTEDHCQLIQRFPNLEILEVRDVIGDGNKSCCSDL